MLLKHRRRLYLDSVEPRRSPLLARVVFGVLALAVAWYLASRVFALFDQPIGLKSAAALTVRGTTESVQVSLQGDQWRKAENGLKLYPGDSLSIRTGGDAVLGFFDGTRLRLEQGSELMINRSDRYEAKTSSLELTLKTGRVWIATPNPLEYSGAIVRTVTTPTYVASVPASTQAALSDGSVVVLRADGAGIGLALRLTGATKTDLIIGEGQQLDLSEDAKRDITGGSDPYDKRDPISAAQMRDVFITGSFTLLSGPAMLPPTGAQASQSGTADLTISSPLQRQEVNAKTVTVAGHVSGRIASLLINGQAITPRQDLSFSAEVTLGTEPATVIHIEVDDAQGIVVASEDRTVLNVYRPTVEPVRIKSPVASGATFQTSLPEVEITGEAPAGTAAVMVNDYRLQLYKAGGKTWSYLASSALGNMLAGTNVYSVVGLDSDGNKSPPRSITIVYTPGTSGSGAVSSAPLLKQNPPLAPGTLMVDEPAAGTTATVTEKEVVIGGRTSAETASISVNGYTLSLYQAGKTTWNYIASTDLQTMKRGKNVYRIVSRNAGGEILDVLEYTIVYAP